MIIVSGVAAAKQDNPYQEQQNIKPVLATLQEQAKEEDVIYVSSRSTPAFRFYQKQKPDNYYYRSCSRTNSFEECVNDIRNFLAHNLHPFQMERMWLVTVSGDITARNKVKERIREWKVMEYLKDRWSVEVKQVVRDEGINLHLLTNLHILISNIEEYIEQITRRPGTPIIRSNYDVYINENRLVYVKNSCHRDDTAARFFLHVFPADVKDLPDHRQSYNFDSLDFNFDDFKVFSFKRNEQCIAVRRLPEYAIRRIRTGQYIQGEGKIWKEEFYFNG